MATGIVTYTRTQANELLDAGSRIAIYTAPNSLLKREQFTFDESSARTNIIFVGRLIREKKPELLIRAFELLGERYQWAKLVVVGDGEQMDAIREMRTRSPFAGRIELHGHIDSFDRLTELYSSAVVSVSPGYVGLNITQSFSFGVPMVLADSEPHSPEIEAAVEGFNCLTFRANDAEDLQLKLTEILDTRDTWRKRGPAIRDHCAGQYSAEAMAAGLIRALEGN